MRRMKYTTRRGFVLRRSIIGWVCTIKGRGYMLKHAGRAGWIVRPVQAKIPLRFGPTIDDALREMEAHVYGWE